MLASWLPCSTNCKSNRKIANIYDYSLNNNNNNDFSTNASCKKMAAVSETRYSWCIAFTISAVRLSPHLSHSGLLDLPGNIFPPLVASIPLARGTQMGPSILRLHCYSKYWTPFAPWCYNARPLLALLPVLLLLSLLLPVAAEWQMEKQRTGEPAAMSSAALEANYTPPSPPTVPFIPLLSSLFRQIYALLIRVDSTIIQTSYFVLPRRFSFNYIFSKSD